MKKIPSGCFSDCTKLESIQLSDDIVELGDYAFSGSGIKTIGLSKTKVKEVPTSCFANCINLENIQLSDDIEELGEGAFRESGIKEIDLSKTKVKKIPWRQQLFRKKPYKTKYILSAVIR